MSAPRNRQTRPATGPRFEHRLLLDQFWLLLPAWLICLFLAGQDGYGHGEILLLIGGLLLTLLLAARLRWRVIFPLYTLSNLLEALREGDYSLRGSRARRGDPIGDVVWEVNALSQTLREQRLQVEETNALIGKVIGAIDIAIFSFDSDQRLRLLNPAGERLLQRPARDALGRPAAELELDDALAAPAGNVTLRAFAGGTGRYELRHFVFRQHGRPNQLLAITDLSRALREEERQAWQRLIRVLGHELNNSLAPIKSMAGTLGKVLGREPLPDDWREDVGAGLGVIAERAEALSRFVARYAALARLPPPTPRSVALRGLLERVVALEQRLPVQVLGDPDILLRVDPDQLEQALINLVKNAVEAAIPERGKVELEAWAAGDQACIEVRDTGLGLSGSDNLFVPFFTTKPGGSGIGLVLAQQIVEGHGGQLSLLNREDRRGCVARISLPLPEVRTTAAAR